MRAVLGCLFATVLAVTARGEVGFTGRILPRVVCEADASQSYALYVPSFYTPQKKWPAILCFDPGARGSRPVERLQAAAEKFGYVIVGSLTSRNGPWAANLAAAQAMVTDVSRHLVLDPNRLYSAGLSGGARVATELALLGTTRGVIACSAGFPVADDEIPARLAFVFFGTAGTEDFNHGEMQRLEGELAARQTVHRIVFFEGGHEWAPAALLGEAVEWLELSAMRAGHRPRDEDLIQAALQTRRAALPAPPGPERWLALKALAADFQGLTDTAGYEREAGELGASPAVKAWKKAEHALAQRERTLRERLNDLAADAFPGARRKFATDLRQLADAAENSAERQMARRVIADFMMSSRPAVRQLFDQKDYPAAAERLEMQVALRPGEPRTYYDLARARAFDGDKPRALAALRQALAAGFRDGTRAEAEPAFRKLGRDPGFHELLVAMATAAAAAPAETVTDPEDRPFSRRP